MRLVGLSLGLVQFWNHLNGLNLHSALSTILISRDCLLQTCLDWFVGLIEMGLQETDLFFPFNFSTYVKVQMCIPEEMLFMFFLIVPSQFFCVECSVRKWFNHNIVLAKRACANMGNVSVKVMIEIMN